MAVTNGPIARASKAAFPQIEEYVQMNNAYLEGVVSTGNYKFRLKNSFYASEAFFKVFSYKLLKGDRNTALKEIQSIVLSESMAKKFFGNEDPMGKIIKYNDRFPLKVTGVFEDVPPNTHMKFEILVSYATLLRNFNNYAETEQAWISDETHYTYLKLKPGTDIPKLEAAFAGLVQKKIGHLLKAKNQDKVFSLMPIKDIHLNSDFDSEIEENGNKQTVIFFAIIAVIILVIGWVNYINLSIATSFNRYKEIGMRLVHGATKKQLKYQFMIEAIMINLIAIVISIITIKLIYPLFSSYTGMEINSTALKNTKIWFVFLGIILLGSFFSSIYPSYILSSLNPVQVLKGKNQKTIGGFSFRKILIGTQFAISVSLVIGTIIVLKQVSFMKMEDPGITIEETVIVQRPDVIDSTWSAKHESFKNELKSLVFVEQVCFSRQTPGELINYTQGFIKDINDIKNPSFLMYNNFVDHDFLKLYNLKLIAGNDFMNGNKDLNVIISRRALKTLSYKTPEEAIGKIILNEGWNVKHKIVGVIEDFRQQSPKEEYLPMVFMHCPNPRVAAKYSIKIKTNDMKSALTGIEAKWKSIFHDEVFEYFFLNEKYDNQYKSDIQFGRIFLLFSIIAISIACVGLFALTLFTILLRKKEISIRKVIGASVNDIFMIFAKDYMILVLIASVIAIPFMYFVMNKWLQDYAVKIPLSIWFFLFPVFLLVLIVGISISSLVLKTTSANPSKNLRTE
jgi:putative ABC transport system permease protein